MKKQIFQITIIILFSTIHTFAQNNNTILQKLMSTMDKEIYLKDFDIELNPNIEKQCCSFVLSKGNIYTWFIYTTQPNQIEYSLYRVSDNLLYNEILPNKGINSFSLNCEKTGVYKLFLYNRTNEIINTKLILSYAAKFKVKENSDSIIRIKTKESTKNENTNNELFFVVEEMPKFNGKSSDEFHNFIKDELRYPQEAIDQKIEGRVFVQFTISKNGYLKDAKVVRSIHPALDQEALRILYSSPKWESGKQRGQAVNVVFTYPITFKL